MSIDAQVKRAVAEHIEWHKLAAPSAARHEPRVLVEWNGRRVVRRPFKSRGHWRVRWAGTARLTDPHEVDGHIVFTADWGRP